MPPLLFLAAVVIASVGVVLTVRSARARGSMRVLRARCELCGHHGPVAELTFHQNTGMLIMRRHQAYRANACRACHTGLFFRASLHTLFLGWWGTISFVLTPLFLLNNLWMLGVAQSLPAAQVLARKALEDQREYALNLLATKDEATVVEVLVKVTGAPSQDVWLFVRGLRRAA